MSRYSMMAASLSNTIKSMFYLYKTLTFPIAIHRLLRDIWHAFYRGYKKRIARFRASPEKFRFFKKFPQILQNNFIAGIYPANFYSLGLAAGCVALFYHYGYDIPVVRLTHWLDRLFSYFFRFLG